MNFPYNILDLRPGCTLRWVEVGCCECGGATERFEFEPPPQATSPAARPSLRLQLLSGVSPLPLAWEPSRPLAGNRPQPRSGEGGRSAP